MTQRTTLSRKIRLCAGLLVILVAARICTASTLHVAPNGAGDGPGTADQPLNLRTALERAASDTTVSELLVADGEYMGSFSLGGDKTADPSSIPELVIRAAPAATPVLHNSVRVESAEAVDGTPGLYRSKQLPPAKAHMWERDTRVRYTSLATRSSVGAIPGSCFVDRAEGVLYFHTSDGEPPQAHEVYLSMATRNSRAFAIYRPHTTVEGLGFRDYIAQTALGFQIYSHAVTIRRCSFDNVYQAFGIDAGPEKCVIEDCTGTDVAQGIMSHGKAVVIRGCRFEKTRDEFLYPLYPQNDCAYQVYHPGRGGTIEGNFARGYHLGVLIKAPDAPYIIRHNTLVDTHNGIAWSSMVQDGSDVSHNIIVDATEFMKASDFAPTCTIDRNLYWRPKQPEAFAERMRVMRGANRDKLSMLADPRFVDPINGDYRILPDSPAVTLQDGAGRPAGAYAVAPAGAADKTRPTLELAFTADTRPLGAKGTYTFDKDPWIGGGTTMIRDLIEERDVPRRLTGRTTATVLVRAFDLTGAIRKMRVTVDGQPPSEMDYSPRYELELPDRDGDYSISVAVQNDRGTWSAPASALVRLDRQAPKLIGQPEILSNEHGLIMAFRTDEPCMAILHYGTTRAHGNKANTPPRVTRKWDPNDGGEWIETWSVPRREFALAVLSPNVKSGETVHMKLVLEDQGGLSVESAEFEAMVTGAAREVHVSPTGKDTTARGAQAQPYRTVQYAVDRALPGDRVILQPGVYAGRTFITHGGVDAKTTLTIEAAQPTSVTLDSAKREEAVIHLESAPYVTLRNLRILYFKKAGVYAYRSPHLTVERCTSYNGHGWQDGYHVFCFNSPHATIDRCLAIGAEVGFYLLASPHARVTRNTCSQHMYGAASYAFSASGSVQLNNSFSFAGNDVYFFHVHHPDELKTFSSDYNNIGSNITQYNHHLEKEDPELWKQMKAEEFESDYDGSRFRSGSKAVIGSSGTRYLTLQAWREASGQDMHSVFADPKYVNPYAPIDSWDWRVRPDSPNIGAGKNGDIIGAQAVAADPSATP